MALKWPTIPEVADDPKSHTLPLRSTKNMLEMLTGQREGAPFNMAKVFVDQFPPGGLNGADILPQNLRTGDLWIDTANGNKLNFWDARVSLWIPTT